MNNHQRMAIALICLIASPVFAATDPDKDPRFAKLIADSQQLVQKGKLEAAIVDCDKIISAYRDYYEKKPQKIYCGTTSSEMLGTLLQAAVVKQDAIVLSPTWANAYFIKAYAFQELHRLREAKAALMSAVALSPTNSHYLNELGEIYELEKNWAKAKEIFRAAEENAPLSPEETRADDLARARRGMGYVYVELGQLVEAEKKYRQCLGTNPNDHRAANELRYLEQLRAKQKK